MSAAPYTRIANPRTGIIATPRSVSRPVTAPRVRIKTRVIPKSNTSVYVLRKLTTLFTCMFAAFLLSTISGQVMLEKVRREGILARQLVVDSHKIENSERRQLDAITNPIAIEEWAEAHGFVAPEAQIESKDVPGNGTRID